MSELNYYAKNKEKLKIQVYSRRKKLRECINIMKLGNRCKQCNVVCTHDYIKEFEFHHRTPRFKKFNISDGASRGYSLKKILREVKKCDLLCKDCHDDINPQRYFL